jgi:hypothetical protein
MNASTKNESPFDKLEFYGKKVNLQAQKKQEDVGQVVKEVQKVEQ